MWTELSVLRKLLIYLYRMINQVCHTSRFLLPYFPISEDDLYVWHIFSNVLGYS